MIPHLRNGSSPKSASYHHDTAPTTQNRECEWEHTAQHLITIPDEKPIGTDCTIFSIRGKIEAKGGSENSPIAEVLSLPPRSRDQSFARLGV